MIQKPQALLLQPADKDFLTKGISIVVSSTDAHGKPVIGRGLGCRVSADRRLITLLLARSQSTALLDAAAFSKRIAATFSDPGTHRTIQLKCRDAVIADAEDRDRALAKQHVERFVALVCPMGYAEPLVRALVWSDPQDLVSVTFAPAEGFEQTPGPLAGQRLRSSTRC